MEREPPLTETPRGREVPEATGREVVDDVDAPVFGQQPVDEGRTDEPGSPRHERLLRHHPCPSLFRFGPPGPPSTGGTRPPEIRVPAAMLVAAPTMVRSVSSPSGLRIESAPS